MVLRNLVLAVLLILQFSGCENRGSHFDNKVIWSGKESKQILSQSFTEVISEYKTSFEVLEERTEFETSSDFEARKKSYLKNINKSRALDLWLGEQDITMNYNADIEKFTVTENHYNISFQFPVSIENAKDFKEKVKSFNFLFQEINHNLKLIGVQAFLNKKEYFTKVNINFMGKVRIKILKAIAKWSKEFNLGLPESWEELQKVRGIIAKGCCSKTKEQFEKDNKVDTTNFYFANTKNIKITSIPKEIGNLSNLTELYLSYNKIKELPKEIGNLRNLTNLNLGWNQIKELPKEIGNLTELDLRHNQIQEIPKEIGNLSNLTKLSLYNNQIKELPKEIGNLSNLTKLYLWSNQIKELPKEIGNLSNLTKLNLGWNQIKELPKEIGNLSNLTYLYLGSNEIKELPKEMGNLTNLKNLNLSYNQIKELPKEIGNFSNLTKLDLWDNKIKELPKEIGNLTNLTNLNLGWNNITSSEKKKIKKLLPNCKISF